MPRFAEWASLFAGKLFVKVIAYVDESGTHDKSGKLQGSSEVVIAGLVAWREDWIKFCESWQSVLNKYAVPYFHFREWTAASRVAGGRIDLSKDFKRNPYQGWTTGCLDAFLFELAEIAGAGNKVVVGGWINTSQFHKAKTDKTINPETVPSGGDPYKHCANQFFKNLSKDILSAWPFWEEPVSIFFDLTDNKGWRHAISDAHDLARQKDPLIKELTFADKKEPDNFPLQAADMVVYRFRQLAERFNKGKFPTQPSNLDKLLLKQFNLGRGIP